MRHQEFIQRVSDLASVKPEEAVIVTAIEATLATIGETVDDAARHRLAAELPNELREPLERYVRPMQDTSRTAEDADEFWDRIATRSGVGASVAMQIALAVCEVLQSAVSTGAFDAMQAALPFDSEALQRRAA